MCSAGVGSAKTVKIQHTGRGTHTHSSILLHTTKTEFWLVPRIEPGARDTGDRSGAVGGVTPLSPVTLTLGNTCPALQCGVTLVLLQSVLVTLQSALVTLQSVLVPCSQYW